MGVALAVAELVNVNNLPKDSITNQFVFSLPGSVPTGAVDVANAVIEFYNNTTTPVNATPLGGYIGSSVSRGALAHRVRVYDITTHLDGSNHGSPVLSVPWSLGGGAVAQCIPQEVALCITLRGQGYDSAPVEEPDNADPDLVPQRPLQRHTGRLYVGPFINNAIQNSGATAGRPTSLLTARLLDSIEACARSAFGSPSAASLSVWSRKDGVVRIVDQASVDDAWDTQRRRGLDRLSKITRDMTAWT